MKILYIIDCVGSGGKERQLIEQLKYLKTQKKIRFQLVVLSDNIYYPYFNGLNVKTYFLKRKIKKDPQVFFKLFNICKEFQPDIIHSWERMCSFYAMPIAKILRLKFVNGAIRNAPSKLKPFGMGRIQDKLIFLFSDSVLANSYAGLKSFNVPEHKACCIYNGFNFSRIKNIKDSELIKKKFEILTPNVVGMVGHFHIRKDYKTFILSAMRILQKRKDVTFLAVGDGSNAAGDENKSTLENCKKMVGPEFKENIKFLGKHNNVESIINIFDIGVLLTNQNVHGEGISNSIMEYMALAKPVIATNSGGTGEIVVNNETGFLVESNNDVVIAEKIEYLLNNKEILKKMGNAGKERLHNEFSIEKMGEKCIALYEKCLGYVT